MVAMKCQVKDFNNKAKGQIELNDSVFGIEPRKDILARTVNWQLAKRRSGTHKVKVVGDIRGTTAKPFRQKGTGRARQGSSRATQFRGGATVHGPVVRRHGYKLPKKIRKLALKCALSSKQVDGKLLVLDNFEVSGKTKDLVETIKKFGGKFKVTEDQSFSSSKIINMLNKGKTSNEKFLLKMNKQYISNNSPWIFHLNVDIMQVQNHSDSLATQ